MLFQVLNQSGRQIAGGQTDNPFQARNIISTYLDNGDFTYHDSQTIKTKRGITIKSTAELSPLLRSTPQVIDHPLPPPPTTPRPPKREPIPNAVTLRQICKELKLSPAKARRILRRMYGAANQRYEWTKAEARNIKKLLKP